jgi:hypothetical protein
LPLRELIQMTSERAVRLSRPVRPQQLSRANRDKERGSLPCPRETSVKEPNVATSRCSSKTRKQHSGEFEFETSGIIHRRTLVSQTTITTSHHESRMIR